MLLLFLCWKFLFVLTHPLGSSLQSCDLVLISYYYYSYYFTGLAAEIQPPDWLWCQVLLLPHVPRRGLHGVEAVLRPGPFEQVRQRRYSAFRCKFIAGVGSC